MKHTAHLKLLALLSFAMTGAHADGEIVDISTSGTSMLLEATTGKPLQFIYYGDAVKPSERADIMSSRQSLADAYPVYGMTSLRETAMSVTHPDGNMTLDMRVDNVSHATMPDSSAVTVIALKDAYYPFVIKLNYRTYPDADVIETWVEAVNQGKKSVKLNEYASAYLPIRRGNV